MSLPSSHHEKGQSWGLNPSLTPKSILFPLTTRWKRLQLCKRWHPGFIPKLARKNGSGFFWQLLQPLPVSKYQKQTHPPPHSCVPQLCGKEGEMAGSPEGTSGSSIRAIQRLSEQEEPLEIIQANSVFSPKGKLTPREGKGFAQGHTGHEEWNGN